MLRLVYVAGKFSGVTRGDVERNIDAAEQLGIEVARIGAMPVIPHANTAHPAFERVQPYEFWIAGTAELLRRCDALITVPGWECSKGACGEVEIARGEGLAVFHAMAELRAWLEGRST